VNRDKLEAEQRRMRQRHPRKLKPAERKVADREQRRKIAKCLLDAGFPPHDVVDLSRLFRGAKIEGLQAWIDRGMPCGD